MQSNPNAKLKLCNSHKLMSANPKPLRQYSTNYPKNDRMNKILLNLFFHFQRKTTRALQLAAIVLFCLLPAALFAQQPNHDITVSGIIKDQFGPLPGVTVTVKSQQLKGTISGSSGTYSIKVPADAVLEYKMIGYKTLNQAVNNSTKIDITLTVAASDLEEVVVVGYGQQKRGLVTSAITSLKQEDFNKGVVRSPLQLLQGKVAGLAVSSNNGDPNAAPQIMLRGVSTLSSSSDPLIVVDGLPGASLNNIAPEDIESIDVLKDGSAGAIYGSRANGGVIIVTTKKNKAGAASVEYNAYLNYDGIHKKMDVFSADEYRKIKETTGISDLAINDRGGSTDWQKEVLRNPLNQVHNLSIRGGNDSSNFIGTVTYRNQNGIMLNSDKNSLIGRLSVNHGLLKNRLRFNVSISNNLTNDQSIWYNAYLASVLRNPADPIYGPDGKYLEYRLSATSPWNPLALLKEETASNRWNQLQASGRVTIEPIKNWNTSLYYAIQRYDNQFDKANGYNYFTSTINGLNGEVTKTGNQNWDNTVEVVSDYAVSFNDRHNFKFLLGSTFQEFNAQGYNMYAFNFPTDAFGPWNIGTAQSIVDGQATMGSSKSRSNLGAFFGRINYDLDNKYVFMLSLRREGSSKFGLNNKWGWFPATSVGWRVSSEGFLKDSKLLNNLFVRAGYGVTGTQPNDAYLSIPLLNLSSRTYYDGKWILGVGPTRNPNPNLRWERKAEFNIGADFSLLNNRLSGSLDYYQRLTTDLLYSYNVPVPPNLVNTLLDNVGDIKNSGLELALNGVAVKTSQFSWTVGGTYSTNTNIVKRFSSERYQLSFIDAGFTGPLIQSTTHRLQEGQPVGNFYGLESVGLDETGANWVVLDKDNNRVLAQDAGQASKRILGNGIPKQFASLFTTLRYKSFDFSISVRGAFDFQILNQYRMQFESLGRLAETNIPKSVLTKPYGGNAYARVAPNYVSYYVEDGDYVKIDNASLGYTIPLKNKLIFKSLRVYAAGLNLYTFTGYKGLDPEVSFKGLDPGMDYYEKYPPIRTWTFGLNLSL